MSRIWDALKTYWLALIIGSVAVGLMIYTTTINSDIKKLESDIRTTEQLVKESENTYKNISKEFDKEGHKKVIQERTVSAEKIGKEMVEVDNELTAFYKTAEPLPEDKAERDAIFERLEKAKEKNTLFTGAGESDHIRTWQLNPEWTLKLESVVNYRDTDRIPVVFSMVTKDGKTAGLIYAIHDTKNYRLTNITKHYTTDGMRDEVDVGGM